MNRLVYSSVVEAEVIAEIPLGSSATRPLLFAGCRGWQWNDAPRLGQDVASLAGAAVADHVVLYYNQRAPASPAVFAQKKEANVYGDRDLLLW